MAEATHPSDGSIPSDKGDIGSASDSQPSADAEKAPTDDENKEPTKPAEVSQEPLSIAEAFKKFQASDGSSELGFKMSIKGIKYWVDGKEAETSLDLKVTAAQAGEKSLTFEGEMKGVSIQKDKDNKDVYYYVPPSVRLSTLLGELLGGHDDLAALNSLLGLELTFRKFVVSIQEVHTEEEIEKVPTVVEEGYYVSIAVYADKKPQASKQHDDQYVLDKPGQSAPPFIPDTSDDAPGVSDQPFCIIGVGKDKLKNRWWAHLGLSLRALMYNSYEFRAGEDKDVDSWSVSLPVVGSLVSSSGRLSFGNPFVSFSYNLISAPGSYLSSAKRFLKETDPSKTNQEEFKKKDYILTTRGKARAGVTLQILEFSRVLAFQYPSSDEEKTDSRTLAPLEDRFFKASSDSKTGLQRYGSVLDPGIIRLGPFTLYKMGLGIEDIERADPSDKTIKSKKLCFVMKPRIMIGAAPQSGKSHGYIDINDLTITIPVGSEKETVLPGRKPPKLISPVQFDFKGMGFELAGENDAFLLRGAAFWDISDTELSASGEVLFRLGKKSDPKFLMTIMMAFWLNSADHKWGFYIYGLAIFRFVRAPIDPVITQTYLTGIALGIGVNYILRIPDIDKLNEFPLVKVLFAGSDYTQTGPRDAAAQMKAYLEPKSKYLWFAAGAEISTLETFTGFLLLILVFGLGETVTWEICLLGILTFADKAESLYRVQLMFKILIAWYGLKIEVALTGSSFILDKKLCLSGSGYLWTFWDGEHAGETIFVLGGYHPDFKKPEHFPNPTPVEISYKRSFGRVQFSLSGKAYFALSNKVVMLGISLEASAYISVIWDWTLWASLNVDILIFWSPFSLDARSRLEVGITAIVKIIVTFRINVRISLELNFWKPDEDSDFGGEFIFKVLSWKVRAGFGASKKTIRPISWQQFIEGDLGLDQSNPNPLVFKVLTTDKPQAPKAVLADIPWMPRVSEPAAVAQDYVTADRLSPEPIFKGISVIPIKDLQVNDKQMIPDKDKSWTSDFGLVPCFYTKKAFQSKLNIKCATADQFSVILEINSGEIPFNVWSPELLIKPNLKEKGIVNTLIGAAIQPKPSLLKTGNAIGPFTSSDLIRHFKTFVWPMLSLPPQAANTIKMATFKSQINSNETCAQRNRLLAAIRQHQPEVNGKVRLNNTAQLAEKVLLALPVGHSLGY